MPLGFRLCLFILTRPLTFGVPHQAGSAVSGKVVGVADGDTLTLLGADRKQHKVRLLAIFAPEKGQAFGTLARQGSGPHGDGQVRPRRVVK